MKHLRQSFTEALIAESPQAKDLMRISDIIKKSAGDEDKQVRLARTMTKLIKNKDKAKRRWEASSELLGKSHPITKVFQDAMMATETLNESVDKDTTAENIYQLSISEPFWKEVSKKFPNYNSDDGVAQQATDWLYSQIKAWWPLDGLDAFENELKSKIHDGIT